MPQLDFKRTVGRMEPNNPKPHPPDDGTSGAAREYLEQERQRSEAASRSFASADTSKTAPPPKTEKEKERKADSRIALVILVVGALVVRQFIGWGPELAVGLVVLAAYYYLVRRYRAYRRRQRANQAHALNGGTSDD